MYFIADGVFAKLSKAWLYVDLLEKTKKIAMFTKPEYEVPISWETHETPSLEETTFQVNFLRTLESIVLCPPTLTSTFHLDTKRINVPPKCGKPDSEGNLLMFLICFIQYIYCMVALVILEFEGIYYVYLIEKACRKCKD